MRFCGELSATCVNRIIEMNKLERARNARMARRKIVISLSS
jgi:hypothetical protein